MKIAPMIDDPYDGLNRRIVKAVTKSGDLNCTYHYYYDKDWRILEERAGNYGWADVVKQMVWAPTPSSNGSGYTDELVQIAVNQDLYGADSVCEKQLWVLPDANYNVMGLVDSDGDLVERYEYSPYGERKVFVSAGTNDPGCYAPTLLSRRVKDSYASLDQPFGLCEFGHQGLPHEEEIDNGSMVQNRMRIRRGGAWYQRDPWQKNRSRPTAGDGYQDGMNLRQYLRSSPITHVDIFGLDTDYYRQVGSLNTSDYISTGIFYCEHKGFSVFSGNKATHAYIMANGVGYGYYAESHRTSSTNWLYGIAKSIGAIWTDGSVAKDDHLIPIATEGMRSECREIRVYSCDCDADKFRQNIEDWLKQQASLYPGLTGPVCKRGYSVAAYNCYTFAFEAINFGVSKSCKQYPPTGRGAGNRKRPYIY